MLTVNYKSLEIWDQTIVDQHEGPSRNFLRVQHEYPWLPSVTFLVRGWESDRVIQKRVAGTERSRSFLRQLSSQYFIYLRCLINYYCRIGSEGVDWLHLVQDSVQHRNPVNTIMDVLFPSSAWRYWKLFPFLRSWKNCLKIVEQCNNVTQISSNQETKWLEHVYELWTNENEQTKAQKGEKTFLKIWQHRHKTNKVWCVRNIK
jgi:hypothetical protein